MKDYYQLGITVTSIILIIAGIIALGSLAFITYERIKNANETITKESLVNAVEEIVVDWTNWRPTLKASAFKADPLEQYEYNLPIKEGKETNTNVPVNENSNENLNQNTNASISEVEDWLNYSNTELGISLKYPSEWGEIKVEKKDHTENSERFFAGKSYLIKFQDYTKIWILGSSSDYKDWKTLPYNGGEDLSDKCPVEGLIDENHTNMCKNKTVTGQETYGYLVALGDECSFWNRKEIRLNSRNETYPGILVNLSLPSSQECLASEEANKEARKTDLENQYNRTNLDQETLEDLENFDLFLSTIGLLEQNNTNTNVNVNLNANINKNVNLNINKNININENLNQNLNLNLNANTNLNQNINVNTNENFNKNVNQNLNQNINENLNQNLNENTNTSVPTKKPEPTDEEQWYKKVKDGTLVFQANWYCSAAGMKIHPHEPNAFEDDIGRWHGDCTNPSVQVTGNFKPIILGNYKKGEKISFRLESDLHRVYETVYTNIQDKCHIDYFPFSGRKDVPAIQYTCDDGYDIGLWDDIQFTVYVFPKGTKIDIPEVIPKKDVDSDGDGLSDDEELRIGTNRTQFDTDGDGYSDKTEVDNGFDPLTAAITPNPDPETFEKKYYFTIPKVEMEPVITN